MNKQTRRMHFVPRTYQRRFANRENDKYFIHHLDKRSVNPDIKKISVSNVCVVKDLYTLDTENSSDRLAIEKFYGDEIESKYNGIYELLIDPAKKEIDEEERLLIIRTITTMLYRNPKWINSYNKDSRGELKLIYDAYLERNMLGVFFGEHFIELKDKSLEDFYAEVEKLSKPDQILGQVYAAEELANTIYNNHSVMVNKIEDDMAEFITSDYPVNINKSGAVEDYTFNPRNLFSLPIDNKHQLVLFPRVVSQTKNKIIRNKIEGPEALGMAVSNFFQQSENSGLFLLGTESGLRKSMLIYDVHKTIGEDKSVSLSDGDQYIDYFYAEVKKRMI